MKIAIIGAGNAGCAHAFKFTEKGHEVALIKTSNTMHEENFEAITTNHGIWCIDHTQENKKSFQRINLITRNIQEGVADAELIVVMTQSLQHQRIAELLCPYIKDSTRMLLIVPGNLGSLFFKRLINNNDLILAEGESTPYDARIIEPGLINILYKNKRNALAFLPVSKKDEGLKIAYNLVDTYKYSRTNIIESALHNPNLVVHTIGTIMSASRIEMMGGEFWMYREAFSPAIWNLINYLDNEKNNVIEAFDGERISYLDACKFRNENDLNLDSLEVFKSYANDGGPKGPASLNTRYLYEDVQIGLCTLKLFAQRFNIKTPVTDALITIASSLVNYDFETNSRKIDDFGLADLTNEELIKLINS